MAFIENAPKRDDLNSFYMDAFYALDSERVHGRFLARIPRSKVMAYAAECAMPYEEQLMFLDIINKADAEHLERLAAKIKSE